jgi:hypothetical protein
MARLCAIEDEARLNGRFSVLQGQGEPPAAGRVCVPQEVAMKIFPHTADASADIPADQGDENVSSVAITAVGLVLFVGAVAYLIF